MRDHLESHKVVAREQLTDKDKIIIFKEFDDAIIRQLEKLDVARQTVKTYNDLPQAEKERRWKELKKREVEGYPMIVPIKMEKKEEYFDKQIRLGNIPKYKADSGGEKPVDLEVGVRVPRSSISSEKSTSTDSKLPEPKDTQIDCDSEEGIEMKKKCRSMCQFYKADNSACHYCEDWRYIKLDKPKPSMICGDGPEPRPKTEPLKLCSLCGSRIGDVDVCPICTGRKTEPEKNNTVISRTTGSWVNEFLNKK